MGETVKISLRCGQKEGDLILLGSQYRLSDMVRLAVDNYLGNTEEQIPVPPMREIRREAFFTVILNSDTAPEAVALMKDIPEGYRSTAIKLLLRHAMARCDLRPLMKNNGKTHKPSEKLQTIPRQPHATRLQKPVRQPTVKPVAQTEVAKNLEEDSIFDGI